MNEAEFRSFLDDISICFTAEDLSLWISRLLLPFSMVTKSGPITLTDHNDVQSNFDNYLKAHRIMKLDGIFRRPLSLEDCHDGTFIGTYETELLSGGQRTTDPYISSALIHKTDDGFKMSSIMNALGHHQWTGTSPATEGKQ